ncbi:hypothetical protein ZWY2020_000138 [Hordeum vulgare]|nr:hypothetical protein ZWY2020_000138 [Hordeum vulgare]
MDESSNHTPNNDNANEDEGMPEVMSMPQQPTTMMRFDTLEDAEKHYKMYARQKGFGVRFQGEMQSLLSYSCKQMGAQEYMVDCIAKFVPGYGNKSFKVHANVEEGFYMCECCKYERDGIVCCHILRIMVQLGVTTLPAAYILKRWTWLADEMLVDMSSQVPGKVHEMPEESVILMKTTLMKNEFASLAKVGCRTADGRKIIGTHLKEMKRELAALAKEQKKRRSRADFAAVSSATAASAPSMSKYAAQPAHSAPIHGFNNQGRSSCGVPFEPSIMGHGATAVSTHTMSNTATPSVYTSPSAASSNNQGRSSNAAAFDPQIEGQSALLAAMSAPVMPNPAAPGVYSAQLGASTRQGHSTYVAPAEPNILGYGATATPAALGAYSVRSALLRKDVRQLRNLCQDLLLQESILPKLLLTPTTKAILLVQLCSKPKINAKMHP